MGGRSSGRRPLPHALKVMRGTRAARLNPQEPQPPSGAVRKPSGLSGPAGRVWDQLAPIAMNMRTLTAADAAAFGVLCELQAMFTHLVTQKVSRREQDAVRRLANALRPYYGAFGLEPSARSRIHVAKPEPVSKWGDLLGKP